MVASLTRRFGDLDIAEEAAAEAFATAVERWPADGVPPSPGAWLTTTANRKAIDRIRRENKRDDKQKEAQLLYDDDPPEPAGAIDDERLRLIFTCCHPALAMETRVALTLRMVAGLTVPEIARAFLVQETTMGQRITRAKAKIKAARIPYRVPSAEDLPARVSGVLAVLFLVFNEGYLATGPDTDPVRHDLTAEAIRLTRLIRALMPDDGEVAGLLALMLLTEARRTARVSPSGELVTLDQQDRGTWDAELIAEGHRLVRERLAAGVAPGRYQILAAISAVHTSARDVRHTDWSQVVALYDQLVRLDPSPIIALNRAIAVAELDGPEVALADIDRLEHKLAGYHAYHAARADLLRRLGRSQKSRAAYDKAIELAGNTAETASLTRRRDQLGSARVAGLFVMAVNRMPAAEVEVSADLVRRLLADQHPDLARLPVEFLANGWDNELYRVGNELVARLPRRALGAQIITNEQRWLPGLAPRLPLPVPYPERTGLPGCGYPYSWSVVPYLPGVPAAEASSFDPAGAAARRRRVPRRAARPRPGRRAGQPVPRCPAGQAGRYLRGQPRPAHRPGRPGSSRLGRGAARAGRSAGGPPLRRPAGVAARRPAPGEHPGERRPGQRRDRLRRHHRGRPGQRPVGGLDAAPARLARQLLVGLPGGRRLGRPRPAGASQRLGAEPGDRVPGPFGR